MEPKEYDEIIRTLVRIAAHQETINEDLRESIRDLREFNREQLRINTRLETLMTKVFRPQENGRDA